ncbi:MarR family transcriptional regulator [Streptomyces pluripotens]|uniref:MarR family transcriptional regulator n=1 Tax=Streptomyces pluripotens TaxID=1355015 RepID=A0A221NSY3_9ACTN|nr:MULTISPECIES: MarR family winged helix-turn-helix transcriptional regulator [Streptomyces]ARP68834.1 MarR family transcriptional regulator [Streptomyces pluripotens]ASN23089.1 MarR family transcriptional regulator [Streptomyces pluripotens]KIE25249.1 hypothetical protein LK08_20355 [Streptomyces sp. MUSC 125]MCH0556811.1 winged helix-turn-helix transcriptional regulator [Streptomyces sp. MUM 16J]
MTLPVTTTPRVDGRTVGLAHYASRALLEHVLAPHGVSFLQFVTLRRTAAADGPIERTTLVGEVADTVKTEAADVHRAIEELTTAGMLTAEGPSRVRITATGRELYTAGSEQTTAIAERLYAGIPAKDRAVTARVLTLVTERANAELAALRG